MEKTLKLKLTDEQKKEIADTLGVSIEQVGVQVAYTQAFDEDAKGNDALIAKVGDPATEGKVWVVEQLNLLAQGADGSGLVNDLGNAAGGLQTGVAALQAGRIQARTAPAPLTNPSTPGATFPPEANKPKKL